MDYQIILRNVGPLIWIFTPSVWTGKYLFRVMRFFEQTELMIKNSDMINDTILIVKVLETLYMLQHELFEARP